MFYCIKGAKEISYGMDMWTDLCAFYKTNIECL